MRFGIITSSGAPVVRRMSGGVFPAASGFTILLLIPILTMLSAVRTTAYSKEKFETLKAKADKYRAENTLNPAPAGQITKDIASYFDPNYHYTIYLPKNYDPKKLYPLMICFSPSGNAGGFVKKFQPLADKYGWIIAGAKESRNGPWEPIFENAYAMIEDINAKYLICWPMTVSMGFSGAARASAAFCFGVFKDLIGGTIQSGAGYAPVSPNQNKNAQVFCIVGTKDANLNDVKKWYEKCKSIIFASEFRTFEGGHNLPPVSLIDTAMEWHQQNFVYRNPSERELLLKYRFQLLDDLRMKADKIAEDGDKIGAWTGYTIVLAMADKFPKVDKETKKLLGEIKRKIHKLEKIPEVKTEKRARDKLIRLIAEVENLPMKKSTLRRIPKRFQAIADKYPDSPSGKKAAQLAKEWQKKRDELQKAKPKGIFAN